MNKNQNNNTSETEKQLSILNADINEMKENDVF